MLLAVAALLLVAACDGSASGSGSADGAHPSRRVTTTDVALPPGDEPVVVTPWGEDLLVGSRAPEGSASRPRLTVLDPAGGSHEVAVTPVSPTAFQAKWLVAAPRGATVDLVGGAPAGAHSNTRWSTWRGDAAAVRELPQPFATFGGWGAGALVSLVQTPSEPGHRRVVGERRRRARHRPVAPDGRALGAGLLGRHGRWPAVPRPGVGPRRHGRPGRAARRRLGDPARRRQRHPAAGGVAVTGPGRTVDAHRPAGRRLAGGGPRGACDEAGRCTVVGEVDGDAAGLGAGGRRHRCRPLGLPTLAVGEHDLLPAPLLRGDGESTVLLASGGVLRCSRWRQRTAAAAAATASGMTGPPARAVRSAARTATGRLRRARGPVRRGPPVVSPLTRPPIPSWVLRWSPGSHLSTRPVEDSGAGRRR